MIWIILIIVGFVYANYITDKWSDSLNPYNFHKK